MIPSSREWEILGEVALAMLLGGLVGFEREVASKPAGLRTHMLVAGAAALLVGAAFSLVNQSVRLPGSASVSVDPIRILQAVVVGISFLGAGTIVRGREPEDVHGLTTAASLLMSSGIGIAAALRQFGLAIGVTLLVVAVLRALVVLERWIGRSSSARHG
jgi:putative Mg2+ transporter-C (MgtC) family protein